MEQKIYKLFRHKYIMRILFLHFEKIWIFGRKFSLARLFSEKSGESFLTRLSFGRIPSPKKTTIYFRILKLT